VLGEGEHLVAPCGGCRQRMREFADPDADLVADPRRYAKFTLEQLLPLRTENLANDRLNSQWRSQRCSLSQGRSA
jgi:cytidine deaminase